jgi:tRNA-binding protein
MPNDLTWEEFRKVDIRTGTIISAEPFEKARKPAYKMVIDFGELGKKKTSAQITDKYRPEALIGRQVVAVVNFPHKQIADMMSECLVLGAMEEDGVNLLQTSLEGKNGIRVG